MIVSSLTLVLLSTAVFTSLYSQAGHRGPVLVIARDISQGQRLTAADLRVVNISSAPGLRVIGAGSAHKVLGKRATVPLVAGTLLTNAEIEGRTPLSKHEAIVGVAVGQGQLPAYGVAAGDRVDVVLTAPSGSLQSGAADAIGSSDPSGDATPVTSGGVLASNVIVSAVTIADSSGSTSTVVSVIVPSDLAPLIASASAAGQAAIVLIGGA